MGSTYNRNEASSSIDLPADIWLSIRGINHHFLAYCLPEPGRGYNGIFFSLGQSSCLIGHLNIDHKLQGYGAHTKPLIRWMPDDFLSFFSLSSLSLRSLRMVF